MATHADLPAAGSILVVGSLNMDLVTRGPKMPAKGETVLATSFSTDSGGKGLNQAVACARACGSRAAVRDKAHAAVVAMIGAVGKDQYGEEMKAELQANGIDSSWIQSYDVASGVATIIVDEHTGDNRILVAPGANYHVELHELDRIVADAARRPRVIVLQLEIPLATTLAVIATAKEHHISVLLNPAPAVKLPPESLRDLDHLIMNETEAGILGEIDGAVSADNEAVLQTLFRRFHDLGVRQTIVTLGAQGVCFSRPDGTYEHVAAVKVERIVDTVAAGDTFVGYYAAEVARAASAGTAFDAAVAVKRANVAAAKTVQREGALVSIPWQDEVV